MGTRGKLIYKSGAQVIEHHDFMAELQAMTSHM
jgi:hypothetical protein